MPPGEPGPISPGAPCPRLAARRSPSPASARVPRRGHPRNFPGSLRTLFLPAGGKRALAPSVQRGRGGGQPASLLPPAPARPPAEASPRLPHCTAAPRRATPCRAVRGARRCPPAPPSPSPAGGMSAGEAKEYLARREIPQLFEVGEAERGGGAGWRGAFSPRRGGAPRWDPRGGQRAEGGWKDGAARGCGAPALRGEPRRGGLAPAPRRAAPGGAAGPWRRPAGRGGGCRPRSRRGSGCPPPGCRQAPRAAGRPRLPSFSRLGRERTWAPAGQRTPGAALPRSSGGGCPSGFLRVFVGLGEGQNPQLLSEVLFSFLPSYLPLMVDNYFSVQWGFFFFFPPESDRHPAIYIKRIHTRRHVGISPALPSS